MFAVYTFILIHVLFVESLPNDATRKIDYGLDHDEATSRTRERFQIILDNGPVNSSDYNCIYVSANRNIEVRITIHKAHLRFQDIPTVSWVPYTINYTSDVPLAISYDLDSVMSAELVNYSWTWLPAAFNTLVNQSLYIVPKHLGLTYIQFWITGAKPLSDQKTPVQWHFNDTHLLREHYYAHITRTLTNNSDPLLGFPVIVLRHKSVLQLIFRVFVVLMVTTFTFTMGCELDVVVMRNYFRKPFGPAIGFCSQFLFMPLIAFGIAKLIPIKPQFGFGLLTIGCSPGGGASNAWSLMLGGDINLSVMMTFISSLCALFMMPLSLFLFGRFFIDVTHVRIPYENIAIQLLQVAIPASLGLGFRYFKPKWASKCTRLTKPFFIFFILFFLTFGIYVNWSIIRLMGVYPIVLPTGALLPWLGFTLSALFAYLLRQPKRIIITIALETGIQNIGVAILVLLYSMPQPDGDLGAIMPISVSIFTPFPLYFIYLGIVIKRRWFSRKKAYHQANKQIMGIMSSNSVDDSKPNTVTTL